MCLELLNYGSNILSTGMWLSLDEAMCEDEENSGYSPTISFCYNANSGQTCFKAFSDVETRHSTIKPGILLCTHTAPGLNLIVNSHGAVEIFIGRQLLQLANDTINMDAQRLWTNVRLESSWVSGHTCLTKGKCFEL